MNSTTFRNRFAAFCSCVALVLLFGLLVYLTAISATETVDMNLNNSWKENVETSKDDLLKNAGTTLLLAAAALGWVLSVNRLRTETVMTVCVLAVAAGGVAFVLSAQAAASQDCYIVTRAAYHASIGDASRLSEVYFKQYPYQLGYALFSEGMFRLFGYNCIPLELFNVFCLAIAELTILRIVRKLWADRPAKLCAFLFLICIQPILFCTFPYGNIPGLMFSVLAVYEALSAEPGKKGWPHVLLAALFIGLAVAFKKNSVIVLAAIVIILAIKVIRKPTWTRVACICLCILSAWGISAGVQKQYEKRFGIEFGKGVPMLSWVAMGINDAFIAPGWYNGTYTAVNFRECGLDPEQASKRSGQEIRTRLQYLKEHPDEAKQFFSEKLRSEWNEPTYQSIWTTQVRGSYGEPGRLAKWVCGSGEKAVKGWMNAVQLFVFAAAAVGTLCLLRKRRIEDAVFPACVLGGFLYHAVCEAKSQYILTYFVLLIPIAAYGLSALFAKLPERRRREREGWYLSGNTVRLRVKEADGSIRDVGVLKLKKKR